MNKKNYLILSGGTGGHVIPAINFGNFLIRKGYPCYLIIDERGKRYASSFKGHTITISSSHLSYNFIGKIKATLMLLGGFIQSLKHILLIRPHITISFGSYATSMPLLILTIFHIFGLTKIFLHEQNSTMGKVNILFSPFANKIFLNFKETFDLKKKYINKAVYVGMPLDDNLNVQKRRTIFSKKNTIKIIVCGGSQGAVSLNYILVNLLQKIPKKILDRIELSIQCPESLKKELEISLNKLLIKYETKPFFYNFIEKLNKSDILISRAGAGTVGDIIFTQIPSIMVPLPSSANNHQFYNANYLAEKNAAILIKQKNFNSNKSASLFIDLITDIDKQINLINNLQNISILNTNEIILKNIDD